ncbi:MAG: 4-(cytidine 5'-diphospho)-2-C-methyl-D-erythritol kinase [bacterium]|jgi:4-diphosphocytidyl-2-C-methyl-D-erythritol kinase|nr:4-(cytidine 5'-diphospho)-2-C-methyl-D-erythritol kinase [bacterium]
MKSIKVASYAKVNLYLRITGVLENGYHSLEMVNSKISFSDEIEIQWISSKGITLRVSDPTIPADETNTAYIAAQRFLEQTHIGQGILINLHKKIPHGAGLGGGSSNAASVLFGLNQLFDCPLRNEHLQKIGQGIGADVPFFLADGCSFVQGFGERIAAVPVHRSFKNNPPWLVLCSPSVHVSTKVAYRLWDQKGQPGGLPVTTIIRGLACGETAALSDGLYNSFESVIYPEFPELADLYQRFVNVSPTKPILSGSGSNMFSLHGEKQEADETAQRLLDQGVTAQVCQLLLV